MRLSIACLAGELYEALEHGFAPGAVDSRQILLQLRGELNWPRSMLAAFVGVSREVMRRGETGDRNPCGWRGVLGVSIKVGTCLKSKSLFVARIETPFATIRAMLPAWLPAAGGTSLGENKKQAGTLIPACAEQKTYRVAARLGELPAEHREAREGSAEEHGSCAAIGNASSRGALEGETGKRGRATDSKT